MNPWVEHVKNFASQNGISYGCALSTPECREEYQQNKTPKQPDYTSQIQKGREPRTLQTQTRGHQGI